MVLKSRAKDQIEGSGATSQGGTRKPIIISEPDNQEAVEEALPVGNYVQSIESHETVNEDEEVPLTTATSVENSFQSIESLGTVNVEVPSVDVPSETTETENSTGVNEASTDIDSSNWNCVFGDSTKIRLVRGDVIRFRSEDTEPWKYGMIEKRAGKTSEYLRNSFQIEQNLVDEPIIVDLEKHQVEKQKDNQPNTAVFLTQEDAEPYIFAIRINTGFK